MEQKEPFSCSQTYLFVQKETINCGCVYSIYESKLLNYIILIYTYLIV